MSSAKAVTVVSAWDAVDPLLERPGIINLASRPCEAGLLSVWSLSTLGDAERVVGDDEGPATGSWTAGGSGMMSTNMKWSYDVVSSTLLVTLHRCQSPMLMG